MTCLFSFELRGGELGSGGEEYGIVEMLMESRGQANYALAKAGVTGLSKAIAKEWGPQFGVRCNT